MPSLRASQINDAITDAIGESGCIALLSPSTTINPRRFIAVEGDRQISVWIYAWTLTHGGRPNLPNEFRVQMTGVDSPLQLNQRGPTVILGYEPSLKMFAGLDISRHAKFTQGSPSVQIDVRTVQKAQIGRAHV